jgi:ribosomal protein L19E
MSDNNQDDQTLSMKVLKGPKQIEREKTESIWDRFRRLQRSLAPLRKGKQIKKGVYRIRRTEEINILDPK